MRMALRKPGAIDRETEKRHTGKLGGGGKYGNYNDTTQLIDMAVL